MKNENINHLLGLSISIFEQNIHVTMLEPGDYSTGMDSTLFTFGKFNSASLISPLSPISEN